MHDGVLPVVFSWAGLVGVTLGLDVEFLNPFGEMDLVVAGANCPEGIELVTGYYSCTVLATCWSLGTDFMQS